jgi:2,4-diaminopentanoate dehydrogenase
MLRVIQVGLGPLGRTMVAFAAERPHLQVVAAVDPAPDIAGRDLAELCDLGPAGVTVVPSLAGAPVDDADVAVLTTYSDLDRVEGQLVELAAAGLPVVSTCEELSYPWVDHPDHAFRLDAAFHEADVACLGTGVNPGFLMDFLPAVLSGLCRAVRHVTVRRAQDASPRRVPFQRKIGAGLTLEEFDAKVADGSLRHVGLPESVQFVAAALGRVLDHTEEQLTPVIADRVIHGGYVPIQPGMACGVEQVGLGFAHGEELVRLEFRAAVGEPRSFDQVEIDAAPPILSTIEGGVNGDIATCAVVLNILPVVAAAPGGLHTMLDLPIGTVGRGI